MKKKKTICPQGKPKQKDKFRRQERKIHKELGRRGKGETGIRKERGVQIVRIFYSPAQDNEI